MVKLIFSAALMVPFFPTSTWGGVCPSGLSCAKAHECAQLLVPRSDMLPPLASLVFKGTSLSDRQQKILMSHPIFEFFKMREVRSIKLVPRRLETDPFRIGGEDKQVIFLESILKYLFPSALVVGGEKNEKPDGLNDLFFRIEDTAETNSVSNIPSEFSLEMATIKPANGDFGEPAPSTLRLPRKAFTHLYLRDPFMARENFDPQQNPNLRLVIEKVLSLGERIVVLSSRQLRGFDQALGLLETEAADALQLFDHIIPLSSLGTKSLPSGQVLIVNDTMGTMIEIHQEAKFVFIQGPINFFESLYTRTLTYFLDSHLTRDGYRDSGMEKMLAYGEDFPNFVRINSLDEVGRPQRIENNTQYSYDSFNDLLDVLLRKLQKQSAN